MLGDVGDQTKASGSNPSAWFTVVAHRLDGADEADDAQSDDGDTLACVLS
jgi:hypothetical protein